MNTIKECIDFANANPVCYLATAEGDQPRVRAMGFWYADETGFYFQTGEMKSITGQLRANPKMEACFYKHDDGMGTMVRVSGTAEFLEAREWKVKALAERPFLRQVGMTEDSPALILFRLAHGQATVWNMENNLKPKEIIKF